MTGRKAREKRCERTDSIEETKKGSKCNGEKKSRKRVGKGEGIERKECRGEENVKN